MKLKAKLSGFLGSFSNLFDGTTDNEKSPNVEPNGCKLANVVFWGISFYSREIPQKQDASNDSQDCGDDHPNYQDTSALLEGSDHEDDVVNDAHDRP